MGAWSAGIFHLMTHAFFKALLFLAAGAVIHCLHHEHNIFHMGGLRTRLPIVFWSFLIGSAALAALPFTSGFYSKDIILLEAWQLGSICPWLWAGGLLGALLTAVYSFRLVFIVFFGEARTEPDRQPGWRMSLPLAALCVLSIAGGWLNLPIAAVFPAADPAHPPAAVAWISIGVPIIGLVLAYGIVLGGQIRVANLVDSKPGRRLHHFWHAGWQMDALYEALWVRPFKGISRALRQEPVDLLYQGIVALNLMLHRQLSELQNGKLRRYATSMAAGLIVLIALLLEVT